MKLSERSLEDIVIAIMNAKTEEGFLICIPLDAILTQPFWEQIPHPVIAGLNPLKAVYHGPEYYGITTQMELKLMLKAAPTSSEG
jgi:hypothetical protein